MMPDHDRYDRYAAAIGAKDIHNAHVIQLAADAAMAVADTEQQELRAELEHTHLRARTLVICLKQVKAELAQARSATLTTDERQFLARVLHQVGEETLQGDDFTEDDRAALTTLRRMAAEPQP